MKGKSQRGEHRVIKGQTREVKGGMESEREREQDRGCGSAARISGVKELWLIVMSQPLPSSPPPSMPDHGPTPPPTHTLQQLFNMEIDLNRS